ncbi:DEAD/DEAH box helicase family protein, partial [Vibrio parahaemolyticus V-223/04]
AGLLVSSRAKPKRRNWLALPAVKRK